MQGWVDKKMDELFDVQSSKRVHKADWKTEGVPFYRAREVVKLANQGFVDNDLFISEDLYEEYTKAKGAPKPGDIIISAVGTLGACYVVKEGDKFYFKDASVLWFSKKDDVLTSYIEYALKTPMVVEQIMDKSMGATVGTLTISRAKNITIPIPPLQEQKQIVKILDEAFAAIDQAKANIEKNIENTQELFQSKLNEIFSQKGDGWEEKELADIASEVITKGATPTTYGFPFVDEGIVFLRSECVSENGFNPKGIRYIVEEANIKMKRSIIEPGDILISITGNIGRVTRYPDDMPSGNINQHIARVRVKDDTILPDFIVYQLLSDRIQKHYQSIYNGAAYPLLSLKQIRETSVRIPDLKKQRNILSLIDKLKDKTTNLLDSYQRKSSNLGELKKSILQKAFSGELTNKTVEA